MAQNLFIASLLIFIASIRTILSIYILQLLSMTVTVESLKTENEQ